MSHGRQHRGKGSKDRSVAQAQAAAFLDDLHRDDPARARKWHQPAPQQFRLQRLPDEPLPAVPRARDKRPKITPDSIQKIQDGDGEWHYYVTDASGTMTEIQITRSDP